jgi:hypothetical protein
MLSPTHWLRLARDAVRAMSLQIRCSTLHLTMIAPLLARPALRALSAPHRSSRHARCCCCSATPSERERSSSRSLQQCSAGAVRPQARPAWCRRCALTHLHDQSFVCCALLVWSTPLRSELAPTARHRIAGSGDWDSRCERLSDGARRDEWNHARRRRHRTARETHIVSQSRANSSAMVEACSAILIHTRSESRPTTAPLVESAAAFDAESWKAGREWKLSGVHRD